MKQLRKPGSLVMAIALLALIQPPTLSAATTSVQMPFSQVNVVPCAAGGAGESVLLSGTLHVVSGVTLDNAGGVHLTIHFQPQGATGVGLTTGDVYQANGLTRQGQNVNSGGLPLTLSFVNNFRLVGPGPGNNLQVHQVTHITINENGLITSIVTQSNTTCG